MCVTIERREYHKNNKPLGPICMYSIGMYNKYPSVTSICVTKKHVYKNKHVQDTAASAKLYTGK